MFKCFRKFLHILDTLLAVLSSGAEETTARRVHFSQYHSKSKFSSSSYPSSCFADYENNLPTGIQYFADYRYDSTVQKQR